MEYRNTKEKLIKALKCGVEHGLNYLEKVISEVEKLELPELKDNWEYNLKDNSIIKYQRYWDNNLNCWNFKNEEVVAKLKTN